MEELPGGCARARASGGAGRVPGHECIMVHCTIWAAPSIGRKRSLTPN